jgi:hypothetical protein
VGGYYRVGNDASLDAGDEQREEKKKKAIALLLVFKYTEDQGGEEGDGTQVIKAAKSYNINYIF